MSLLFADMVPPIDRMVTSPVALSVSTIALIVTCVITVILIRRRSSVTRTGPPPGT